MKLTNEIRYIFGFERQKGQIFSASFNFQRVKPPRFQTEKPHRWSCRQMQFKKVLGFLFFFSFMSLLKESDGVCSEHGKGIS